MTLLLLLGLLQGNGCGWMNEGTAAGILGGQATVTASRTSCEFSHGEDRLRLEVFVPAGAFDSYVGRCKSSAEKWKAIGNEAVVCDGENSGQMAIGRVRDQVFVFELKAGFGKAALREKLKAAAEIVAGNLY